MLCSIGKSVALTALVFLSCHDLTPTTGIEAANEIRYRNGPQLMKADSNLLTLFLCGDVMTGRGIDQALPHPGNPRLHESYLKNAKDYLHIAEQQNGSIRTPVAFSYIWGDALKELEKRQPDLRIINLETSITTSNDFQKNKAVLYRMHPDNVPCLTAAAIDGCALANNHVLDWKKNGLLETLETLENINLKFAGAGRNAAEAALPAIWELKNGRVILFSYGMPNSGVPWDWAAAEASPGVNFLRDFSNETLRQISEAIAPYRNANSSIIFSIHWGSNWGYKIPTAYRDFAHRLIDEAGVDLVHGHSSHHFKGIEVHNGKLILYGSGDFINDYEGIGGKDEYRGDLALMYFPTLDPVDGRLVSLEMEALQMRNFKLNYARETDASWMLEVLNREGVHLGTSVEMSGRNTFILEW